MVSSGLLEMEYRCVIPASDICCTVLAEAETQVINHQAKLFALANRQHLLSVLGGKTTRW